jgi:hypothetical protein
VDLIRWRQDLIEDRNRLATLLAAARQIDAGRDAKLNALREMIALKVRRPINAGNRKVLVFTAFADTANYLYENLALWAKEELGLNTALVTGSGRNRTTVTHLGKDLGSILTAFSPRSKERPEDLYASSSVSGESTVSVPLTTRFSSSISGPTWSWMSTSIWNSGSAARWSC